MAAVLRCGPAAMLSHESAAALWRIRPDRHGAIEISIPADGDRRPPDLRVHRRANLTDADRATHRRIPVTSPICTLIDLATRLSAGQLEAAINEADKLDLADPEGLREALDELPRRPGLAKLRSILDGRTFTLTDSELERRFLAIVERVGLPRPLTQQWVNGYKVDFYWSELGLVVETDGLRYHRTPAQQVRDRLRDQAHTAAGLTPLRFTRAQVRFDVRYVEATVVRVAARLGSCPEGA